MPHGFSNRPGVHDDVAAIPQFSAGFRPDFNVIAPGNSLSSVDQQKAGLSLWVSQANSQISPNSIAANSNLYMSSSVGFPEMVQMGSANLYGSSSSTSFGNLTLSGLPQGLKEEAGSDKGRSMVDTSSVSLFSDSSQTNKRPKAAATPMSATALLQKAAQMGSTRSSQSFFGNSYGLMSSSASTTTNPISLNQNPNELHQQVFQNVRQPAESLTTTTTTTSSSAAMADAIMRTSSSNLDQILSGKVLQNDPTQLKLQRGSNSLESDLTRDFLGIRNESGRPFSPQDLAKFAAISSAMSLNQFTGNP